MDVSYSIDPITRYVHISYSVPRNAPDTITVQGKCRLQSQNRWQPACILLYTSETAFRFMGRKDWEEGVKSGTLRERYSRGLTRTLVWNPLYLLRGSGVARFKLLLLDGDERIEEAEITVPLENGDVVVVKDWSQVVQKGYISENPSPERPAWWYRKGQRGRCAPMDGTSLEVKEKGVELPQLTYPLHLAGYYAIFVCLVPKFGCVELRLTGDDCPQMFESPPFNKGSYPRMRCERFWRWTDMSYQHLVIRQPYRTVYEYEDDFRAHLDYLRLVPLTSELVATLNKEWSGEGAKRILAAYNEPYSWAFYENVQSPLSHWESVLPFAEAKVDIIDVQIGRIGSKMDYESRKAEQLLGGAIGDEERGKIPQTDNVGRKQQYTNALAAQKKCAEALGLRFFANMGATSCYPGTPIESAFSKEHPEWRDTEWGHCLLYEAPEVREFALSLFEEALDIGAEAVSLDWCRRPNALASKETATTFFRQLRELADAYGRKRGKHIDILSRFPAYEDPRGKLMDYGTWIAEGLVDFLCPSLNGSTKPERKMPIHGFDIRRYVRAVRGTSVKLLPDVYIGPHSLPGIWFNRILDLYENGAHGVYVYQCDELVHDSPETKRYVSIAGSPGALKRWRKRENEKQPRYSKGVYLSMVSSYFFLSWADMYIWVEGMRPEAVKLFVDGEFRNSCTSLPYMLENDEGLEDGIHVLTVRLKEGGRWYTFDVDFRLGGSFLQQLT